MEIVNREITTKKVWIRGKNVKNEVILRGFCKSCHGCQGCTEHE